MPSLGWVQAIATVTLLPATVTLGGGPVLEEITFSLGRGERLGIISNPYDDTDETEVVASICGLVIGRTNLPVVNLGDALFHIARMPEASAARVSPVDPSADPVFDEDEII